MQLTQKMRYFLTFGLMVLLVGCGFHLRGNVSIPGQYKTAYIESNEPAYSRDSISYYIKKGLGSELTFVESRESADLIIDIRENYDSRIVASNATGQYRSHTIALNADISLRDRVGNIIIPSEVFSSSENFTLDERYPLAKSTAEDAIKRELAQELSNSFIRRLQIKMRAIK